MDFIIDNYFWFIIAGFVLLMIVIGYYAEKSNFGKGKIKEDKKETGEEEVLVTLPEAPVNEMIPEQPINIPNEQVVSTESEQLVAETINNSDFVNIPEVFDEPMQFDTNVSEVSEQPVATSVINEPIQTQSYEPISNPVNVNQMDDDIWKF